MKEIKFLINKYSFIASLGVILAFFISCIGAIALKDISMNLVFSCIAFFVLFYIKGIVKNKFDILRYPNNYYNIGETFCLSVIFLLLPTISIVLGFITEELEISKFTLVKKCVFMVISMSILFALYNGYNSRSCKKIMIVLGICSLINIIVCGIVYVSSYSLRKVIYIVAGLNIVTYIIPAIILIYNKKLSDKQPVKEKILNNNLYRYKTMNGKITTIYKELFKGVYIPVLKYKNYFRINDREFSTKWFELVEKLEKEKEIDQNQQLVINNFFDNAIFKIYVGTHNRKEGIIKYNLSGYCFWGAILYLIACYRVQNQDRISATIGMIVDIYMLVCLVYGLYQTYLVKRNSSSLLKVIISAIALLGIIFIIDISIYSKVAMVVINGIYFSYLLIKARLVLKEVIPGEDYFYFIY